MADGLSITASVIAVAGLALSSSRVLYDTISAIKDAPQTLRHLNDEIAALSSTIQALEEALGEHSTDTLDQAQKSNLINTKPILEGCRSACTGFHSKIERMLPNSKPGDIKWQGRLKLHFQDREIGAFQARLGSYKSTLAISLEFSTLTVSQSLEATEVLEVRIEEVATNLTSQMQGLQIGLQAALDVERQIAETQQSQVLRAIEEQIISLNHCYRACLAALKETTKATGNDYKCIKVSKQAILIAGNVGDVTGSASHTYSHLELEGGRTVAGNINTSALKDILHK